MGLFGGFKAKFSKDSVAKSNNKSSKNKEVVCLGYRVYSEFADPPHFSNQLPPEKRPLPDFKIPTQKSYSNNVACSSAANFLPENRNIEKMSNEKVEDAENRISNGLTNDVSSRPNTHSRECSISTLQKGIITNPRVKSNNGISSNSAARTATLGQNNVAETSIITNPKVKKPQKKKTAKDIPVSSNENATNQKDKTDISNTTPEERKSDWRTKSNNYVTKDLTSVDSVTSSVNLTPNDRVPGTQSELRKTPPKSILKAKSRMQFQEAYEHSGSNTLSASNSSQTVTYSANRCIDESQVNKGYARDTRGIGNTSSFAANLFFAVDGDDDDADDDNGGITPGKNGDSAEC